MRRESQLHTLHLLRTTEAYRRRNRAAETCDMIKSHRRLSNVKGKPFVSDACYTTLRLNIYKHRSMPKHLAGTDYNGNKEMEVRNGQNRILCLWRVDGRIYKLHPILRPWRSICEAWSIGKPRSENEQSYGNGSSRHLTSRLGMTAW